MGERFHFLFLAKPNCVVVINNIQVTTHGDEVILTKILIFCGILCSVNTQNILENVNENNVTFKIQYASNKKPFSTCGE